MTEMSIFDRIADAKHHEIRTGGAERSDERRG